MFYNEAMLTLSLTDARRLVLRKQRLEGPRLMPDKTGLVQLLHDLRCVQLDPISAVARTHWLVPFSRLGAYDVGLWDEVLFRDKLAFEYWAHCASIVPMEDYAIHAALMRRYHQREGASGRRHRDWIAKNQALRRRVLDHLRRHGPSLSRDMDEHGVHPQAWVTTGWTSGRNLSRMLDTLWLDGTIMVAGRQAGQKLWDLARRVLPAGVRRRAPAGDGATRLAAVHSLSALGVGSLRHVNNHYTRFRYPHLPALMARLVRQGEALSVHVEGQPGEWFMLARDLPLLEAPATAAADRAVLLSPFDNLICDRIRTRQLFDFDYTIEIYVPAAKRKYGYYVLPILHRERLIGRIDPLFDRPSRTLRVNAVYAEPGAPADAGPAVATAIRDLAAFLGAINIQVGKTCPPKWRPALKAL